MFVRRHRIGIICQIPMLQFLDAFIDGWLWKMKMTEKTKGKKDRIDKTEY
jgi:hypothetical protein